ncbi:MAG: XRE family transcriptional regulator [Lachnospiraceae bacterium]|nr:XRE family transcriptional regulator [Lachnospiraceae bacterium]
MAEFKDIIKKLRTEKNMSQADLASELGISNSSVAMWEIGRRYPSKELYEQIADLFNVDIDFLYGRTFLRQKVHFDNDGNAMIHHSEGMVINVLGRVAAGIPIEAVENIIDTEEITEEMAKTGTFFGLQIHGNSMEPRMCEGDVVIVRKQDDAESGDVVIAMVNGDDATCKRLRKYRDGIELVSNNPIYAPMFFSNEEIVSKPVKIIGKVVELRGKL